MLTHGGTLQSIVSCSFIVRLKFQNFRGNQDAVNPMTHRLAEPIITRNLRLKPQHWSAPGACLRLELFGCEDGEFSSCSA